MSIWEVKVGVGNNPEDQDQCWAYLKAPHGTLFNGRRVSSLWEPPSVDFYPNKKLIDFISPSTGTIMCSRHAWEIIMPFIREETEMLPVVIEGFDYVLFHVTNVIDCLNKSDSEFENLSIFGSHSDVFLCPRKLVFEREKVGGVYLFKIPSDTIVTFATDAFRNLILSHGLSGVSFLEAERVRSFPF